ncbi:MAG: hypothetical protein KAU28_06985, partial [Phycisphaerae bacterium]|nr:hypothetical protein [Phycisphaerae bacterium]
MAFRIFRFSVTSIVVLVAVWMIMGGMSTGMAVFREDAPKAELILPFIRALGGLALLLVVFWFLWSDSAVKRNLENIFAIPELLGKLAFTLGLLCIYRIGFH